MRLKAHLRPQRLDVRQAAGRAWLRCLVFKVIPLAALHRSEWCVEPRRGMATFETASALTTFRPTLIAAPPRPGHHRSPERHFCTRVSFRLLPCLMQPLKIGRKVGLHFDGQRLFLTDYPEKIS